MKFPAQRAESLPFSRENMASVIGVSKRTVGNWIDRNQLWQTDRYGGYYRLSDVFDLAGFAAMRTAHIPERQCAQYVYNFGFYRTFLHGQQLSQFSFRDGQWDIGLCDPSAIVSIVINMRTVGQQIFERAATAIQSKNMIWPHDSFEILKAFYEKAIEFDRLDRRSVPLFDLRSP